MLRFLEAHRFTPFDAITYLLYIDEHLKLWCIICLINKIRKECSGSTLLNFDQVRVNC